MVYAFCEYMPYSMEKIAAVFSRRSAALRHIWNVGMRGKDFVKLHAGETVRYGGARSFYRQMYVLRKTTLAELRDEGFVIRDHRTRARTVVSTAPCVGPTFDWRHFVELTRRTP